MFFFRLSPWKSANWLVTMITLQLTNYKMHECRWWTLALIKIGIGTLVVYQTRLLLFLVLPSVFVAILHLLEFFSTEHSNFSTSHLFPITWRKKVKQEQQVFFLCGWMTTILNKKRSISFPTCLTTAEEQHKIFIFISGIRNDEEGKMCIKVYR